MNSRKLRKIAAILTVSAMVAFPAIAQDRNAVIDAYNEGAKASQTDPVAAIKAFENAITLADKVGDSAADLKQKASQVLPGLYMKVASIAINEKKPVPEMMKAAKAAKAVAEKYGTQAQKDNATIILVQAYNSQATSYFAKSDFANALVTFDSLLAVNPNYVNAIFNKALIFKQQNNAASFGDAIDLYIEKAKATNDTLKVKQASGIALEYFRAAGSKANQAEKLDDALALLDKASKYGSDKNLFYYYADVYNKKKNFDKGAEFAKKGLDLETGTPDAKAKFYFQLGIAQAGKGKTAEACASFKNSVYGPFAEPSKIQMKNLKCQ